MPLVVIEGVSLPDDVTVWLAVSEDVALAPALLEPLAVALWELVSEAAGVLLLVALCVPELVME